MRSDGEGERSRSTPGRTGTERDGVVVVGGDGTEPLQVEVLLQRLDAGLPLPSYAQPGDAGADLRTAEDVELAPGARAVVGTGVAVALPLGYAAFVHPRSGLGARYGLSVLNTPGTVDAGYRGEVRVLLVNHDRNDTVRLHRGDRIAQLVVQQVAHAVFRPVEELPTSARGAGGYGSTGGHAGADQVTGSTDGPTAGATPGERSESVRTSPA